MNIPRLREEHGAVATIVAIMLVVLLGMAALVIDEGWLLGSRRRIVQGTDASALAAAMSCGLQEGQGSADGVAVSYAQANDANAVIADGYPFYDPSCDAPGGRVTVEVTSEEEQFFAPAAGRPATAQVRWRATAVWGAATGFSGVVPFMLNAGRLSDCDIPPVEEPTGEKTCEFYLNNKDVGNAQWSTVDFENWGIQPGGSADCSATPPEMYEWISGATPLLTLKWPEPTYVCRDTGATPQVFTDGDKGLASLKGEVALFPVNDAYGDSGPGHGQVDHTWALCPPSCSPRYFDIVGFAKLEIVEVWRGKDIAPTCAGFDMDTNSYCIRAKWIGYTTQPDAEPCVECENFGVIAVRLDA